MIKALTPTAFKDSVILSSEQRQILEKWLKETRNFTNTSLLYLASRDGWYASNFHSCCDNKGPTVTVVKSGKYIFGGYTEKRWEGKYYLISPCSEETVRNITIQYVPFFVIKVNFLFRRRCPKSLADQPSSFFRRLPIRKGGGRNAGGGKMGLLMTLKCSYILFVPSCCK